MWGTSDDGGFGKSRFDQTGAGGGGGFLNTTTSSPGSAGEKKKPERLTNVMPCTIAQIHLMPDSDENLKIGTLSAKIITFVGLVQSVDVQTTKATYMVDDCTGPAIEIQMWMGEDETSNKKFSIIQENTYARITGAIRSLKGKRHVIAFHLQPIKDINEITMHIAEVVHASMAVAAMDKQSTGGGTSGFGGSTSMIGSGMDTSSDTFATGNSRKLTKPQQLVKQAIMTCKDDQGINVRELHNSLKSLTRPAIQDALDFLSNEGHIYSTIDEDHYKSTDCV